MSQSIAVIVAHPDDEVLSCGATIAWHADQGDQVFLLVLSEGEASRCTADKASLEKRNSSLHNAGQILGIKAIETENFPDNSFDAVPLLNVVKRIENFIRHYQPTMVYTHSQCDLNIDHQIVNRAVVTAARPQPGSSVKAVFAGEVVSASEWNFAAVQPFRPNVFRDVSPFVGHKMKALACYQQEIRVAPHSRSIETVQAQLTLRGHTVGVVAAEAFELIYAIDPVISA